MNSGGIHGCQLALCRGLWKSCSFFYGKRSVKKKKTRLEGMKIKSYKIQLFRERLSEKVHATIPKGIVGGFEFTVFQRNLKEWHEKP